MRSVTLNYKDALAITGQGPVVRHCPMVPGIDFTGTVAESGHPDFTPGGKVVLNGWGVGETHWGGLARRARVKGDWLVPLPDGIDLRQAAAIGTAGYTAMLCVLALEQRGITSEIRVLHGAVDRKTRDFISATREFSSHLEIVADGASSER